MKVFPSGNQWITVVALNSFFFYFFGKSKFFEFSRKNLFVHTHTHVRANVILQIAREMYKLRSNEGRWFQPPGKHLRKQGGPGEGVNEGGSREANYKNQNELPHGDARRYKWYYVSLNPGGKRQKGR